jgi:alkyl sulfatase BDS1-like metallo-beta-lactamase superfamily hydrolase
MATVAECEQAFATLATRLANADADARRRNSFDRTISCRLTDLDVVFAGRLQEGLLTDIRQVEDADAQVKLTMSSDDLIKLVDQELNMASAWTSGRVKIDARVFDLIKLRSVF